MSTGEETVPRKTGATSEFTDPRPLIERAIYEPDRNGRKAQANRTVTFNMAESPLCWLHARGYLTDRQLLAGESLRGDYEAAAMGPHVTMCWNDAPRDRQRRGAPQGLNATERMISAKARFDDALVYLGRDLSDIAWRVICAGESIPGAERAMTWPVRSGKIVLRIALDRLAEYYRLQG